MKKEKPLELVEHTIWLSSDAGRDKLTRVAEALTTAHRKFEVHRYVPIIANGLTIKLIVKTPKQLSAKQYEIICAEVRGAIALYDLQQKEFERAAQFQEECDHAHINTAGFCKFCGKKM
jgi:hypothetical protein